MFKYGDFYYLPILKWKLGEVQALRSVRAALAAHILPLFVVPPASEYDYDKLHTVTLVEHLKQFGARLKAYRGDLPSLIDASLLDTPELAAQIGTHPLTALLERARQSHAFGYPVVSIASSPEYLDAAKSFLARHDHVGFGVRLRVSELDNPGWVSALELLVASLNQRVAKGVLIIDAGPIFGWDEQYVDILIERINSVPWLKGWGGLFFSSTSFPEVRSTPSGSVGRYERSDRELFEALFARRQEIIRTPRFSDYALEFPSKFRKGGGTPKAHLRYSSYKEYVIGEGVSTKGNGYVAIYPVAENLVKQPEFRGRDFSSGNAYVADLAARRGPGNPSMWRWSATDHHLALVTAEQDALFAFLAAPEVEQIDIEQDVLPWALS